eukprot:TRINITY_DN2090_c0_g1_i3.p1 TRINITY_DN2090_c0_g1~~TRINITY_DN2090_c0_g1_i3.p1  ORF type:complete len:4887 (-),score=935.84 TRINITY_DN2090_c0_g1_i3:7-14667(-)
MSGRILLPKSRSAARALSAVLVLSKPDSQPVPCGNGTFTTNIGLQSQLQCEACPNGTFCTGGRITGVCSPGYICYHSNDIAAPKYNDDRGGLCPVGYYCPEGTPAPIPCANHTLGYNPGLQSQSDCQPCRAGYYCLPESLVPFPCLPGYYCPLAVGLVACPPATYQPFPYATNATACTPCKPKFYCPLEGMANYIGYPCPEGHYCTERTSVPHPCPAGTYLSVSGGDSVGSCVPCPGGFYCPEASSAPIPCPASTYCPERSGNTTMCPGKYYCPPISANATYCPATSYCPPAASSPLGCKNGTYCPAGSEIPLLCPAGYRSNNSSVSRSSVAAACEMCPAGNYGAQELRLYCEICNAGWICLQGATTGYPEDLATERGYPCPAGYYCPAGVVAPIACPPGTFNPNNRSSSRDECLLCPAGSFTHIGAQTDCFPCGSSAWSEEGADTCICNGTHRAFQKSDKSCICEPGYEFYSANRKLSEEDSTLDCQPKIYERCGSGTVRSMMGNCVEYQASDLCAPCADGRGSVNTMSGLCQCNTVQNEDEVCDKSCRANQVQLCFNPVSSTIEITDPVSGNSVSLSQSIITSGSTSCSSSEGCCAMHVLKFTSGTFAGMYNLEIEAISSILGATSSNSSAATAKSSRRSLLQVEDTSGAGAILNPAVCLNNGEGLIWDVSDSSRQHYPVYLKDSLLNTNPSFDYGEFRRLADRMKSSVVMHSFSFTFAEAGVYVFADNANRNQVTVVRVVASYEACPTNTPFLPLTGSSTTLLGLATQTSILLTPDWILIGVLLIGVGLVLGGIILGTWHFRHATWGNMGSTVPRYRNLGMEQLAHGSFSQYASKGGAISRHKLRYGSQKKISALAPDMPEIVPLPSNEGETTSSIGLPARDQTMATVGDIAGTSEGFFGTSQFEAEPLQAEAEHTPTPRSSHTLRNSGAEAPVSFSAPGKLSGSLRVPSDDAIPNRGKEPEPLFLPGQIGDGDVPPGRSGIYTIMSPIPDAQSEAFVEDSLDHELLEDDFWDYERQIDLEGFNVRTLYDKLEDQTIHVVSQLAAYKDDTILLYNKIMGETEGLKDMLLKLSVNLVDGQHSQPAAQADPEQSPLSKSVRSTTSEPREPPSHVRYELPPDLKDVLVHFLRDLFRDMAPDPYARGAPLQRRSRLAETRPRRPSALNMSSSDEEAPVPYIYTDLPRAPTAEPPRQFSWEQSSDDVPAHQPWPVPEIVDLQEFPIRHEPWEMEADDPIYDIIHKKAPPAQRSAVSEEADGTEAAPRQRMGQQRKIGRRHREENRPEELVESGDEEDRMGGKAQLRSAPTRSLQTGAKRTLQQRPGELLESDEDKESPTTRQAIPRQGPSRKPGRESIGVRGDRPGELSDGEGAGTRDSRAAPERKLAAKPARSTPSHSKGGAPEDSFEPPAGRMPSPRAGTLSVRAPAQTVQSRSRTSAAKAREELEELPLQPDEETVSRSQPRYRTQAERKDSSRKQLPLSRDVSRPEDEDMTTYSTPAVRERHVPTSRHARPGSLQRPHELATDAYQADSTPYSERRERGRQPKGEHTISLSSRVPLPRQAVPNELSEDEALADNDSEQRRASNSAVRSARSAGQKHAQKLRTQGPRAPGELSDPDEEVKLTKDAAQAKASRPQIGRITGRTATRQPSLGPEEQEEQAEYQTEEASSGISRNPKAQFKQAALRKSGISGTRPGELSDEETNRNPSRPKPEMQVRKQATTARRSDTSKVGELEDSDDGTSPVVRPNEDWEELDTRPEGLARSTARGEVKSGRSGLSEGRRAFVGELSDEDEDDNLPAQGSSRPHNLTAAKAGRHSRTRGTARPGELSEEDSPPPPAYENDAMGSPGVRALARRHGSKDKSYFRASIEELSDDGMQSPTAKAQRRARVTGQDPSSSRYREPAVGHVGDLVDRQGASKQNKHSMKTLLRGTPRSGEAQELDESGGEPEIDADKQLEEEIRWKAVREKYLARCKQLQTRHAREKQVLVQGLEENLMQLTESAMQEAALEKNKKIQDIRAHYTALLAKETAPVARKTLELEELAEVERIEKEFATQRDEKEKAIRAQQQQRRLTELAALDAKHASQQKLLDDDFDEDEKEHYRRLGRERPATQGVRRAAVPDTTAAELEEQNEARQLKVAEAMAQLSAEENIAWKKFFADVLSEREQRLQPLTERLQRDMAAALTSAEKQQLVEKHNKAVADIESELAQAMEKGQRDLRQKLDARRLRERRTLGGEPLPESRIEQASVSGTGADESADQKTRAKRERVDEIRTRHAQRVDSVMAELEEEEEKETTKLQAEWENDFSQRERERRATFDSKLSKMHTEGERQAMLRELNEELAAQREEAKREFELRSKQRLETKKAVARQELASQLQEELRAVDSDANDASLQTARSQHRQTKGSSGLRPDSGVAALEESDEERDTRALRERQREVQRRFGAERDQALAELHDSEEAALQEADTELQKLFEKKELELTLQLERQLQSSQKPENKSKMLDEAASALAADAQIERDRATRAIQQRFSEKRAIIEKDIQARQAAELRELDEDNTDRRSRARRQAYETKTGSSRLINGNTPNELAEDAEDTSVASLLHDRPSPAISERDRLQRELDTERDAAWRNLAEQLGDEKDKLLQGAMRRCNQKLIAARTPQEREAAASELEEEISTVNREHEANRKTKESELEALLQDRAKHAVAALEQKTLLEQRILASDDSAPHRRAAAASSREKIAKRPLSGMGNLPNEADTEHQLWELEEKLRREKADRESEVHAEFEVRLSKCKSPEERHGVQQQLNVALSAVSDEIEKQRRKSIRALRQQNLVHRPAFPSRQQTPWDEREEHAGVLRPEPARAAALTSSDSDEKARIKARFREQKKQLQIRQAQEQSRVAAELEEVAEEETHLLAQTLDKARVQRQSALERKFAGIDGAEAKRGEYASAQVALDAEMQQLQEELEDNARQRIARRREEAYEALEQKQREAQENLRREAKDELDAATRSRRTRVRENGNRDRASTSKRAGSLSNSGSDDSDVIGRKVQKLEARLNRKQNAEQSELAARLEADEDEAWEAHTAKQRRQDRQKLRLLRDEYQQRVEETEDKSERRNIREQFKAAATALKDKLREDHAAEDERLRNELSQERRTQEQKLARRHQQERASFDEEVSDVVSSRNVPQHRTQQRRSGLRQQETVANLDESDLVPEPLLSALEAISKEEEKELLKLRKQLDQRAAAKESALKNKLADELETATTEEERQAIIAKFETERQLLNTQLERTRTEQEEAVRRKMQEKRQRLQRKFDESNKPRPDFRLAEEGPWHSADADTSITSSRSRQNRQAPEAARSGASRSRAAGELSDPERATSFESAKQELEATYTRKLESMHRQMDAVERTAFQEAEQKWDQQAQSRRAELDTKLQAALANASAEDRSRIVEQYKQDQDALEQQLALEKMEQETVLRKKLAQKRARKEREIELHKQQEISNLEIDPETGSSSVRTIPRPHQQAKARATSVPSAVTAGELSGSDEDKESVMHAIVEKEIQDAKRKMKQRHANEAREEAARLAEKEESILIKAEEEWKAEVRRQKAALREDFTVRIQQASSAEERELLARQYKQEQAALMQHLDNAKKEQESLLSEKLDAKRQRVRRKLEEKHREEERLLQQQFTELGQLVPERVHDESAGSPRGQGTRGRGRPAHDSPRSPTTVESNRGVQLVAMYEAEEARQTAELARSVANEQQQRDRELEIRLQAEIKRASTEDERRSLLAKFEKEKQAVHSQLERERREQEAEIHRRIGLKKSRAQQKASSQSLGARQEAPPRSVGTRPERDQAVEEIIMRHESHHTIRRPTVKESGSEKEVADDEVSSLRARHRRRESELKKRQALEAQQLSRELDDEEEQLVNEIAAHLREEHATRESEVRSQYQRQISRAQDEGERGVLSAQLQEDLAALQAEMAAVQESQELKVRRRMAEKRRKERHALEETHHKEEVLERRARDAEELALRQQIGRTPAAPVSPRRTPGKLAEERGVTPQTPRSPPGEIQHAESPQKAEDEVTALHARHQARAQQLQSRHAQEKSFLVEELEAEEAAEWKDLEDRLKEEEDKENEFLKELLDERLSNAQTEADRRQIEQDFGERLLPDLARQLDRSREAQSAGLRSKLQEKRARAQQILEERHVEEQKLENMLQEAEEEEIHLLREEAAVNALRGDATREREFTVQNEILKKKLREREKRLQFKQQKEQELLARELEQRERMEQELLRQRLEEEKQRRQADSDADFRRKLARAATDAERTIVLTEHADQVVREEEVLEAERLHYQEELAAQLQKKRLEKEGRLRAKQSEDNSAELREQEEEIEKIQVMMKEYKKNLERADREVGREQEKQRDAASRKLEQRKALKRKQQEKDRQLREGRTGEPSRQQKPPAGTADVAENEDEPEAPAGTAAVSKHAAHAETELQRQRLQGEEHHASRSRKHEAELLKKQLDDELAMQEQTEAQRANQELEDFKHKIRQQQEEVRRKLEEDKRLFEEQMQLQLQRQMQLIEQETELNRRKFEDQLQRERDSKKIVEQVIANERLALEKRLSEQELEEEEKRKLYLQSQESLSRLEQAVQAEKDKQQEALRQKFLQRERMKQTAKKRKQEQELKKTADDTFKPSELAPEGSVAQPRPSTPEKEPVGPKSRSEDPVLRRSVDTWEQHSSRAAEPSTRRASTGVLLNLDGNSPQPVSVAPSLLEEIVLRALSSSPLNRKLERMEALLEDIVRHQRRPEFSDTKENEIQPGAKVVDYEAGELRPDQEVAIEFGGFIVNILRREFPTLPPVHLKLSKALPRTTLNSPFAKSFFFDPTNHVLHIHDSRLGNVGEFTMVLLHSLAHVAANLASDPENVLRFLYPFIRVCCEQMFVLRTQH